MEKYGKIIVSPFGHQCFIKVLWGIASCRMRPWLNKQLSDCRETAARADIRQSLIKDGHWKSCVNGGFIGSIIEHPIWMEVSLWFYCENHRNTWWILHQSMFDSQYSQVGIQPTHDSPSVPRWWLGPIGSLKELLNRCSKKYWNMGPQVMVWFLMLNTLWQFNIAIENHHF